MRALLKLVLAALLVNAAWRVGSEYLTHYRFREAVRERTADNRSEDELRGAILAEASGLDVPLVEEDVAISLSERHVVVRGRYVKVIELLPGYERPWTFTWTVETFRPPPSGAISTTPEK